MQDLLQNHHPLRPPLLHNRRVYRRACHLLNLPPNLWENQQGNHHLHHLVPQPSCQLECPVRFPRGSLQVDRRLHLHQGRLGSPLNSPLRCHLQFLHLFRHFNLLVCLQWSRQEIPQVHPVHNPALLPLVSLQCDHLVSQAVSRYPRHLVSPLAIQRGPRPHSRPRRPQEAQLVLLSANRHHGPPQERKCS